MGRETRTGPGDDAPWRPDGGAVLSRRAISSREGETGSSPPVGNTRAEVSQHRAPTIRIDRRRSDRNSKHGGATHADTNSCMCDHTYVRGNAQHQLTTPLITFC